MWSNLWAWVKKWFFPTSDDATPPKPELVTEPKKPQTPPPIFPQGLPNPWKPYQLIINNPSAHYSSLIRTAKLIDRNQLALSTCKHLIKLRATYDAIEKEFGVPWWMVAVLHYRESNCNMLACLSNGEQIIGTGRTTKLVPRGKGPYATFAFSAKDALEAQGAFKIKSWDIETSCHFMEAWNGFGYQKKGLNSPYLWSFTNHESRGMYVADGQFDLAKTDPRPGTVALILGLLQLGVEMKPITIISPEMPKES
jgi:lysozyme family protein